MPIFIFLSLCLFATTYTLSAKSDACADGEVRVIRIPQHPPDTLLNEGGDLISIGPDDLSSISDTYEEMDESPSRSAFCELAVPAPPSSPKPHILESLSTLLDELFDDLQSFIGHMYFNARGFEQHGPRLEEKLTIIEEKIERLENNVLDGELKETFEHIVYMFSKMGGSIEILKHFQSPGSPGYNLIWSVVEMNVRLLALLDSKGRADLTTPDFLSTAHAHLRTMNFLETGIKAFQSIEFSAKMVFKNEFKLADCMLECLTYDLLRPTLAPARTRCAKKCAFP